MTIRKSTFWHSRKCEFGNFELVPDKGWALLETFIDYESGLLIVKVNDEDERNWEDLGYDGRKIPVKEFIIDRNSAEILNPAQWSAYFNYEKTEFITPDNKYKLITQRIHDPGINTDTIHEELEDLDTGVVNKSNSLAFRKDKRETLLESWQRQLDEEKRAKEEFARKPDLIAFHQQQVDRLQPGSQLLFFYDDAHAYKLSFDGRFFSLSISEGTAKGFNPDHVKYGRYKQFESLDLFLAWFFKDKWYEQYRPIRRQEIEGSALFTKPVTDQLNHIRKSHRFSVEESYSINSWQSFVWTDEVKETEYKQYCPICFKESAFQARYPKAVCSDCYAQEKRNDKLEKVSFSNIGFSGGLRVSIYDESGKRLRTEDDHTLYEFSLGDHICTAEEARFGGVVIQLKE